MKNNIHYQIYNNTEVLKSKYAKMSQVEISYAVRMKKFFLTCYSKYEIICK